MTRSRFAAGVSGAFGALFTFVGLVEGTSIAAKSVSLADVRVAVAAAKDGDTVIIPSGSAIWKEPLNIVNNITLRGAGMDSTIIIDEVLEIPRGNQAGESKKSSSVRSRRSLRSGSEKIRRPHASDGYCQKPPRSGMQQSFVILINLKHDLPFRLSGVSFRGSSKTTGKSFNGRVRIKGKSHSFRIDHCSFEGLHGVSLAISGFLWGVIDHCQFNTAGSHPIIVKHEAWNGKDKGNGSWADDPYWGSERFVFIEDNIFQDGSAGGAGIDSFEGARFVVRHNRLQNVRLVMHGTEGQGRGAKQVEEYNNNYTFTIRSQAGQIRSGSIVTHGNTWANVKRGHLLQAYRQYHYSPHWGIANGQNPYDDNAPRESSGYWETGKHTGGSGALVLTDSTKHWVPNQWYVPGATFIVRNMTQESAAARAADKIQSFVVSNTSDSITCSSLSFTSKRLTFNTGDRYQIWKIVRSLDQPGLGGGDLLEGLPGRPAKWPHQVAEPCYSWNNTDAGETRKLASSEPSIKEGRDFFNETPKPGYKPYPYPHPLAR